MIPRLSLATVFAAALLIGAAYASAWLPGGAPGWAPWAMTLGTAAMLVGTMALGAQRGGRLGSLWFPFGFVFLVLVAGFGAVLSLPPADPADPTLWLGLPPRAATVLYGIGLLPLLVVPVAYALTFDRMTLSDEDLARVRAAAARLRAAAPPEAPAPAARTADDRRPMSDDPVEVAR